MPEEIMYRILIPISVFIFIAACGGDTPEPAQTDVPESAVAVELPLPGAGIVAYRGAAIWDGTGGAMKYNQSLLVRDGRIEGYAEDILEGAEVVDLGGNWIVPGFINAHGHVSGRWAADDVTDITERVKADLTLYARYGVTSVVSLGGAPLEAFALRAMNDDPALSHARLQVAGAVAAGDTPGEAAAIALANIDKGVDWIKIRVDDNLGAGRKMSWDAVQVVMNAAKAADIPVATHIYYMDDAARLLEMGTGLIAHSVRDQAASDEFVQALLDSGVCYVPTLVREVSTFVYEDRPDWFDDPFFLEAAKQSEIDRVSQPDFMARVAASPASAAYKNALVQAQENLRIILGSGVPVAFGTDTGPAGRFLGYFAHLEFDLMTDAGMTPREILMSATSVAADCVNFDDVGTLEAGKWADFVVLTEDPTKDIKALRSIKDVYIAGNAVDR
jgi:imidazolonepropionase-like amidohydrolase